MVCSFGACPLPDADDLSKGEGLAIEPLEEKGSLVLSRIPAVMQAIIGMILSGEQHAELGAGVDR